jgi:hypothetical protein
LPRCNDAGAAARCKLAEAEVSVSDLESLRSIVALARVRHTTELELQDGLAEILTGNGIGFVRERALGDDRVDFFIEGIALEVKTRGGLSDVTRQLHGYAEHEDVTAVLLATTLARHNQMPDHMNGKPVAVAHMLGGAF